MSKEFSARAMKPLSKLVRPASLKPKWNAVECPWGCSIHRKSKFMKQDGYMLLYADRDEMQAARAERIETDES